MLDRAMAEFQAEMRAKAWVRPRPRQHQTRRRNRLGGARDARASLRAYNFMQRLLRVR
jgi:hypothetical protein